MVVVVSYVQVLQKVKAKLDLAFPGMPHAFVVSVCTGYPLGMQASEALMKIHGLV